MNIQYCSDLHLEFEENKRFLRQNPIIPKADILVLAGDIVPFKELKQHDYFFNYVSKNWKHVYWIPGNHEYYRSDILDRSGKFIEKIMENVSLLNHYAIEIDDVRLIFSTMWTHVSPRFDVIISQGLNDFKQIKINKKRFTIEAYNQFHILALDFLYHEIVKPFDGKKIVVTHHVPTFLNWNPEYKVSHLNEAFGVELHDLIQTLAPNYWIFGHDHYRRDPFQIGKTTLLTNQLGYVFCGEHHGFNREAVI